MPPAPPPAAASAPDSSGAAAPAAKVKSLLPFDLLRVGLKLAEGWRGVIAIAIIGGAAAGGAGWLTLRNKYTVQVQLVRREVPNTFQASEIGESFRPRQFTSATVMTLMMASSILEKTGAELKPPVDGSTLQRRIELRPDKNTELITVAYTSADSPQRAADELNHYAGNVVKLLEDLQAQEAQELLSFLGDQITRTQANLNQAYLDLQSFAKETGLTDPSRETDSLLRQVGDLDLKIEMAGISRETTAFRKTQIEKELERQNPVMLQLAQARARLTELQATYTAQNPFVIEQTGKVKALEEKSQKSPSGPGGFQDTGNALANSLYLDWLHIMSAQDTAVTEEQKLQAFRDDLKKRLDEIPDKSIVSARLRSSVTSLETTRDLLAGRQREAQLFAEKALGYYRVFSPATPESMEKAGRGRKIILLGAVGGIFSAGLLLAWRALRAALDDRLVSPSDLRRMVRAPIAAMLPAESGLTPDELDRWRFTTWAEVVKHCSPPPEGALIAGLLSAGAGEGKTTWLRQLSLAALDRGLKVLAIHCGPSGPAQTATEIAETQNAATAAKAEEEADGTRSDGSTAPDPETEKAGKTGNDGQPPAEPEIPLPHTPALPLEESLRNPSRLLENLRHSHPPEIRLAPAPGFEWTPAWRELWRTAIEIWAAEPALAVLIELPPASRTESLLLAETLPALFWLSDSGHQRRRDLAPALDTIRGSGLPITASFLNRVPGIFLKLPDLGKFGLSLAAGFFLLSSSDLKAQSEPQILGDPQTEDGIPVQEIPSATSPATSGILPLPAGSPEAPAATTPPPEPAPAAQPQPPAAATTSEPKIATPVKTETAPAVSPVPAPSPAPPAAPAKSPRPAVEKTSPVKNAKPPRTPEKAAVPASSGKTPAPASPSGKKKPSVPASEPDTAPSPPPSPAPAPVAEKPPVPATPAEPKTPEPAPTTPADEKSPAPGPATAEESTGKPAPLIPLTPGEAPPVTLDGDTKTTPAPATPAAPADQTLLPNEPPPMDNLPDDTARPGTIPDALPPGTAPAALPPATPVMLPGPAKKPAPPPPAHPSLDPWQQELRLGPGDTVNFSVYGYKQYTRTDVPIGPDGTLTYLQVSGFKAGGLTIDQLREGMTKALGAYIQNARVIVTPGSWRSKKYYMLGTVVDRGVFTLDRPMSLMEAAARARGMETGFVEESTVELSDMKRAFIVRAGKRLPVDFAKLFYDGDMSQNIQLQPGDYIYFPSTTVNEVYVLGSVGSPGPTGMTPNLTAIGAITIRGGFARTAWTKRVLIVRGPMEKPQVIVVDAAAILSGKQRDIPLEPLDLVYVTDKPWKYAAQVLDSAVKTFVQSAANSWVDENVQSVLGLTPSNN